MTDAFTALDLRRHHDQQIRAWFGEVRPLRLEGSGRFFTPPPALPLRAVFVPPALSPSYLQASAAEPDLTGSDDVLAWLSRQHRIVVLGDPGSGKSTLIGWLAWRLCAGLTEPLPAWCDGVLPVPMILRDMLLGEVNDFDDLVAAYLQTDLIRGHKVLREFWAAQVRQLIESNPQRLLFLIDGLDELSQSTRDRVREAIRQGMKRWPEARFVVTSRIVGYEQCAIEGPNESGQVREVVPKGFGQNITDYLALFDLRRLYVMPFDAGRIRQFARNWFEHGETDDRRGEAYLQKFIDGLMRDPVALQLGRTPNLLVMAAQVFGITNTLPDGRAKLYEAITKAYLESIDQRYGLVDQRYSLEQKKSWLAAVGYRMQSRRSEAAQGNPSDRDLLVAEAEVVAWLDEAMRESGLEPDAGYVRTFVDAIARRSGLFIPRDEGLYAFAHLSIQEYFAALHLQTGVRDFAVTDPGRLSALFDELGDLAGQAPWREALITFFELPDWSPRVIARLCEAVFGVDLATVPDKARRQEVWAPPTNSARVELLARLVVNPVLALPAAFRQRGFDRAVAYLRSERRAIRMVTSNSGVLAALTGNEQGCQRVWALLRQDPALLSGSATVLDLGGSGIVDFSPLAEFTQITELWLSDTGVADLAQIAGLHQVKALYLDNSRVSDITPLAGMVGLRQLSLRSTGVSDLLPLAGLPSLEFLDLAYAPASDFSPLAGLLNLIHLYLGGAHAGSLTPIAGLSKLTSLGLYGMPMVDVGPLKALKNLRDLGLYGSQVKNQSALRGLSKLKIYGGPGASEVKTSPE